jgi:hypothetical protein
VALTVKSSGPLKSQRSGTIWARLSAAYPAIREDIVIWGQSFVACQTRFRAESRRAIPIAAHANGGEVSPAPVQPPVTPNKRHIDRFATPLDTSAVRQALVALLLAVALAAAFAAPAGATTERIKVDAFAEAYFGCPAFFPPAGTICHETHVQLYREADAFERGPVPQRRWQIFVERYRIEFVSDDPNVPPLGPFEYASGTLDDPAATFDEQHLASASVQAVVSLSDGTTAKLNILWTPTSDRLVFGNDGPFLVGADLPRHFNDRCVTINNNAHQKLRFGTATGTADGAPFHSYTDFPFSAWMGTAQYLLLSTTHGNCA